MNALQKLVSQLNPFGGAGGVADLKAQVRQLQAEAAQAARQLDQRKIGFGFKISAHPDDQLPKSSDILPSTNRPLPEDEASLSRMVEDLKGRIEVLAKQDRWLTRRTEGVAMKDAYIR
jgi:hypothetical protein